MERKVKFVSWIIFCALGIGVGLILADLTMILLS